MKFKKLNTTLTLTANIGVLIGIFLVAYELRQNDDNLNASIQLSVSNSYEQLATLGVENPSLREAIFELFESRGEISNETSFIIMAWQYRYLTVLFTTFNLYKDDIVSEAFWLEKASHYTVYFISLPGFKSIHDGAIHEEMFSPDFFSALDTIYANQMDRREGQSQ